MVRDSTAFVPRYRPDTSFYDKVRSARSAYQLANSLIIPPYTGQAFLVKRSQTFRVVEAEGPQIADVLFWNAHNPKEYFSVTRTWLMEGIFVRIGTRLWSNLPWYRPLAICVDETVDSREGDEYFRHHFIKTHCCAEDMEARTGRAGLNACHLNLLQAVEPYGLSEEDIHDNINVHQKMRLDPKTGKSINAPTTSRKGDYIEFYANIDLLVAVSVCPSGDNTAHQAAVIRPIGIEVYATGIEPQEFVGWTDWRTSWSGRWTPPG